MIAEWDRKDRFSIKNLYFSFTSTFNVSS